MPEILSDEALALRTQGGDARAFEELFGRYKGRLVNFIYRMLGNRETAEEVAQEVFMKAFRNIGLYDPDKKFATWFFTIARNQTRNALRDRKYFRDKSLDEAIDVDGDITLKDLIEDPGQDPAASMLAEELEREAQRVLESLPPEYREVVTLCSVQGMTYAEAGQVLGISASSVMARLLKAKDIFMSRLGIKGEGK